MTPTDNEVKKLIHRQLDPEKLEILQNAFGIQDIFSIAVIGSNNEVNLFQTDQKSYCNYALHPIKLTLHSSGALGEWFDWCNDGSKCGCLYVEKLSHGDHSVEKIKVWCPQ